MAQTVPTRAELLREEIFMEVEANFDPFEDFLLSWGKHLGLSKSSRSLTADWNCMVAHVCGHVWLADGEDGSLELFVHVSVEGELVVNETLGHYEGTNAVEMKALAQYIEDLKRSYQWKS